MLVAAFHLSITIGTDRFAGVPVFASVTWWGYRGVDFFFVLSGFIILLAHRRDIGRPDRLGRYAWKRASRIYPAYWLYTAVVLAISAAGSGTLLASIATGGDFLSTLTLVRFGDVDPAIGVAWTLFHEIVFYTAFAALIINRRLGIALFAIWGVTILWSALEPTPHSLAGTLIGSYNMNFFFGLAAYGAFRRLSASAGLAALAASPVLLGVMIALEAGGVGGMLLHAGYAAAFALAIFGAARAEANGLRMSFPGLSLVGDASYSIYLTHVTMQTYLALIAAKLGLFTMLPGWAAYIGILVAGTLVGIMAYLLVEKPLLRLLRPRPAKIPHTVGRAALS
ncbi:peptidoglycan/LPS O-acetylase OafA/YrhL [Sphingomonas jejuensis]|uniref:Peptidoglycan/LPS O-acetylase OafA/YrhL n=2 Tax=Sphingomonas jejuensis TaxID=904715 RepID=A0ABX0XLR1_9SPHN|nr:peptidoglycan/LPS O-acetylase OafA/YrhL [Sphingomonas jejuensis]